MTKKQTYSAVQNITKILLNTIEAILTKSKSTKVQLG